MKTQSSFGQFHDPVRQSKILFHTDIYRKADLFNCIISHFGGTPLAVLVDLLNGFTGVEGVALFQTAGDLSGTLDGVCGRDAIVGISNSFLSTAGANWKVWFSSIWVLKASVFPCTQMWLEVKLCSSEFLVGMFHLTPV